MMNTKTLSMIARLRGMSASDLARLAKVSRAAVSLWMKRPVADIRARHLQRLAGQLGVSMETLMNPLPLLDNSASKRGLATSLLWDRLYPSIEDFAVALAKRETRAVARLVEVRGMFEAEQAVGREIWSSFNNYRLLIHPVRRKECSRLCATLKRLRLI